MVPHDYMHAKWVGPVESHDILLLIVKHLVAQFLYPKYHNYGYRNKNKHTFCANNRDAIFQCGSNPRGI